MKEAILYEKLQDKKVRCCLCCHRCLIAKGQRGVCGVRKNQNGLLYSLNYGLSIAVSIDPVEKKPLFHFLPGSQTFSIASAGCNFRCEFCQNWQISQITKGPKGKVIGTPLSPRNIVQKAIETGCRSVAYTYTEPTIFFEYAQDTAKLAKDKGLLNIFVTNGYQTPETIKKMTGLIDAANIDLKSFRDEFYQKICGARLAYVLDSIKLIYQAGIHLEITTLLIPNRNDSPEELKEMAEFLAKIDKDIPWHLSRFHPEYQMTDGEPTPMERLKKASQIGKEAGLRYVYLGNVMTETGENTYCPKCQTLCIKRRGYESWVLMADEEGCCQKCGENLNLKM